MNTKQEAHRDEALPGDANFMSQLRIKSHSSIPYRSLAKISGVREEIFPERSCRGKADDGPKRVFMPESESRGARLKT